MLTGYVIGAGLVILFSIVGYFIWDRRYRGVKGEGDFVATGEVFRDPKSGRFTRVYEDRATGRRQYREES